MRNRITNIPPHVVVGIHKAGNFKPFRPPIEGAVVYPDDARALESGVIRCTEAGVVRVQDIGVVRLTESGVERVTEAGETRIQEAA